MYRQVLHFALVLVVSSMNSTLISSWQTVNAAQNIPQLEFESLNEQLSIQIDTGKYKESLGTIASIKSSGQDYEAEIFYYQGVAYLNIKQYSAAEAALRVYIELAGSRGKHFQEALETIDWLEVHLEESLDLAIAGNQNESTTAKQTENEVADDLESKICDNLLSWHTTRRQGYTSANRKQFECGSHYILDSDGKRKLIWRTRERND